MRRYEGPQLLAGHHRLSDFDCGVPELNDWLTHRAHRNQRSGASRTWVITGRGDQVVAYYASSTAVLLRANAPKRAARNQPDPLPALLLGRLAVDLRHQGGGLAAALLRHFLLKALEVAVVTGVRLVLVHAQDPEAASFYRHFGFESSPMDELTLLLLLDDI